MLCCYNTSTQKYISNVCHMPNRPHSTILRLLTKAQIAPNDMVHHVFTKKLIWKLFSIPTVLLLPLKPNSAHSYWPPSVADRRVTATVGCSATSSPLFLRRYRPLTGYPPHGTISACDHQRNTRERLSSTRKWIYISLCFLLDPWVSRLLRYNHHPTLRHTYEIGTLSLHLSLRVWDDGV